MTIADGDVLFDTEYNNLREAAHEHGVITGLGVTQRGAGANMSVDVAAGDSWVDNIQVNQAATSNVVISAADPALDRIDIITMDSSGTLTATAGTPAANPSPPDLPSDEIMLAYVAVNAAVTTIINSYITDKREFIQGTRIPIGSILPWAKSFTGVPSLPWGWEECNGQVLSDSDSPLNGQTLPDLNVTQRFLRGAGTSGSTGGSDTHSHTIPGGAVGNAGLLGSNTTNAASTLPAYYQVVFIIKTKH